MHSYDVVIHFYSILIRCYCSAFLLLPEIMNRDRIHSYGLRTTAYAYEKTYFGEQESFVVAALGSKAIGYLYEVVPSCVWCHIGDFQYGFSFHPESSYVFRSYGAFLLGGYL